MFIAGLVFVLMGAANVAAQQGPIRVNAGGPAYTDSKGQAWSADFGFNNGSVSGCAPGATVTGTPDPTLFKSARVGTSSSPELQYSFAAANGNYQVNLYFAETCTGQTVGARVFDVQMQGATVFSALDIFATVGTDVALIKSANVSVSNGTLAIRFVHRSTNPVNNPIIYAIEIIPAGGAALPPAPISVSLAPATAAVQISKTQPFTATLQNDTQNMGVNWSLSGAACSGAACGTLSASSSASGAPVTYTAPGSVPTSPAVNLTAISVADNTKSASTAITLTTPAPPISVSVAPLTPSVQVSQTTNLTATVQNDSQNEGVTWSLSGAGCSGVACGTLSATSSASGTAITYTAPASLPTPAAVSLKATSVADNTKFAFTTITITAPPPPISVSVAPQNPLVLISQTLNVTATVQNDSQNQGVTWSVSGAGCSGATCGTLSATTSSSGAPLTYTAPAIIPNPPTVSLQAASVTDSTKSASTTATIVLQGPIRVNAGGPAYTDSKGQGWSADFGFNNGSVSGCAPGATVTGTPDPTLFKSARVGTSSSPELQYSFAAANGNYQVNLYFAETCTGQTVGARVFDVQMQGATVFSALDIFATVGTDVALIKSANVSVTNGTLAIRFVHRSTNASNNPIIYAIEIIPAGGAPPPPAPISVSLSPATAAVQVSKTQPFTATLQNDTQNLGVNWLLSGTGCFGAACGALTSATTTSVTYTAPATVPAPATVTLTAQSVADNTRTAAATITVSAAPAIVVTVSPATAGVQAGIGSQNFTATLQNDSQNKGVAWLLSGAGCSGVTCGTLSAASSASGVAITYTAPASVPTPSVVTLTATSVSDGTKSAAATITISLATAAKPVIAPATGTFTTSQSVTITDATSGATIFYTLDGSTPTTNSTVYTAAIPVASTTTIKAIAGGSAFATSPLATSVITINLPLAATPVISPAGGSFATAQTVTITDATSGAAIYYTTDGSTPSTTSSTQYTGPILVSTSQTITALAAAPGNANSSVASASYTIGATTATPTLVQFTAGSSTENNLSGGYVISFPNPTLRGNLLACAFSRTGGSLSTSVSDDQGQTWTAGATNNDTQNGETTGIYYFPNTIAGVRQVTIHFSADESYMSAACWEFYNVALSNPTDTAGAGHSDLGSPSTTVTSGSFTTTTPGDLILMWAFRTGGNNTVWRQGASPWRLTSADAQDGMASQYQIQSSAGAINPTLTTDSAVDWSAVGMAFKPASAGTPPALGARVISVLHFAMNNSTAVLKNGAPTNGNMFVVAYIGSVGMDICPMTGGTGSCSGNPGVSDSNSNIWLSSGPKLEAAGNSQQYYACNANPGTPMTITINMDSVTTGANATFYDVTGMESACLDKQTSATGTQSGNTGDITAASVTPAKPNGVLIGSLDVANFFVSGTATANCYFDSTVTTPNISADPADENNGWMHCYPSNTSAFTTHWTSAGGPFNVWGNYLVSYNPQ